MTATTPRSATVRLWAPILALSIVAASILPLTVAAPVAADDGLQLVAATAEDSKSIVIDFDRPLDEGLRQYIAGNANAIRPFIRISGGAAGEPDSALNGADLQTVNASVFPVDTAGDAQLRIVLPAATTLVQGRSYQLWLDGEGTPLGELQIKGADGSAPAGTTTPPVSFTGPANAAELARLESVEALTSRVLRVTFADALLSGMPAHTYSTNPPRITVVGAPAGVRPVYVQKIDDTDSRVYDIYLNGDLDAGQAYSLQVLGNPTGTQAGSAIRTSAGTAPPSTLLAGDGSFTASAVPHSLEVQDVSVNERRNQVTVRFNHKVSELATLPTWMPGQTGNRPVLETPVTGTTGDSLTAEELATFLTVRGRLTPGEGDPPAPKGKAVGHPINNPVDLTDDLRYKAAYFADRQTLVVSLTEGKRLRRGALVEVELAPESLIDVSGAANGPDAQTASTRAPDEPLPPRSELFDPNAQDYLTVDTDASVVFKHFDYTFATNTPTPNYRVDAANVSDRVVDEVIDAIVVENKYIKATFVPDYGARLLSLVYKPTGNDLLYANPVGTPYGHGNNSPFYANWLMVWGGVAPTFSEPEHGKYWFLPWDYEITQTDEAFTITMTKVDTINHRLDSRFRYGATGLEIEVSYTVYKDRPSVDMNVSIHNPGGEAKEYEYWTLTTLGPGRPLHEGSPTMEHLAPLEKIRRDSAYTWMANVERRVNPEAPANSEAGRELYFDNMRYFSRWLTGTQTGGIAYGLDLPTNPQGNWWGVVNHENAEGVIRVSDNTITRGMKFWTWGFNASFDTNPYSRGNSARPYVEPWGGVSDRFFLPDVLGPGETKSWTETFMPLMDMHDVTNATADGAGHVEFGDDGSVTGYVFPTGEADQVLRAVLTDAATGQVLATETFRPDPYESFKLTGDAQGAETVQLTVTSLSAGGDVVLTAEAAR